MSFKPRTLALAASLLALSAWGSGGADSADQPQTDATSTAQNDYGYETYGDDNLADTMASNDERYMNASATDSANDTQSADIPDPEDRPIMQAQVVLDRIGFGPGVIDGKMGMSTENALNGFQEANDLDVTGELDDATKEALAEWERIPATRVVTIPASWSDAEYTDIPEETEAQAELERMGYKSLDERLAERFHTTVDVLKQLNPNGRCWRERPTADRPLRLELRHRHRPRAQVLRAPLRTTHLPARVTSRPANRFACRISAATASHPVRSTIPAGSKRSLRSGSAATSPRSIASS